MAKRVYILPEKVWDYCQAHGDLLKDNEVLVAQDEETGYEVSVTAPYASNSLRVHVFKNGIQVTEEYRFTKDSTTESVKTNIHKYLDPVEVKTDSKKVDVEKEKEQDTGGKSDEIYEREDALIRAASDFLEVALGVDAIDSALTIYGEDIVDEFMEAALRYLTTEYMAVIYRPMLAKDENGEETLIAYPYLSLISDEEDEPSGNNDNSK